MGSYYKKGIGFNLRKTPLVSVIIPTYNEEKNIGRLLASIKNQTYINKEVIIVDQSSDDNTIKIARRFSVKIIKLPKPHYYSPPGIKRNIGANASKGTILMHLDADMELPNNDIFNKIVTSINIHNQALVLHEIDITKKFWGKCKALERSFYWNTPIESARIATKKLFQKVGCYNEIISSGEDFAISQKYKEVTKVVTKKELYIYHHTNTLSFKRMMVKKFNYGRASASYFSQAHHKAKILPLLSIVIYLQNIRQIFLHPILYIMGFFLRIAEGSMLFMGLLFSRFTVNNGHSKDLANF